jgi:diguanylate cyclase (GGDEF)-like protein/PAS domain S-box-containing protein
MHKMKDEDKTKEELLKDLAALRQRVVETAASKTEFKRAESELRKLSAAVEHTNDIVFITDTNGVIEFVNPIFENVTGYSGEEAVGQTLRILSSGMASYAQHEEMWKTIKAGQTWRGIFKNKKRNGEFYWANGVISPLKDEKGEITHFLSVQEDITERKVSEERVEYLGSHDEMTGLVNRARSIELLDNWISVPGNRDRTGVLLLINLDEFKFINNTCGHGFGDEFLRRVANMLESAMEDMERESIVGRLGGDEFVIFLPYGYKRGRDENVRMLVAEGVRKRLEGLSFGEVPGRSTASIGVVFYPEHGTTTKELLTRADAAMYRAKELGCNRCHLYRPEDRLLEKMHSRVEWKERVIKALAEDRFEPWFQPILDLRDNKVYHYEALARMCDEEGNILLPGAFIEVAERFGLIGSIDRVIIEKTMGHQTELSRRGRPLIFSMNLSGKDLGDDELLSFLKSRISDTGADPNRLVFEITETAAVHDLGRAIKFIKDLKSMGCHFALDDFGVGFTSFVYLKEMNVDYIKIDGSFIKTLHSDANDRLFVKAMTDVAKGMGIKTVAEFAETEETLRILRELGVDYAQGFMIGKPMPLSDLLRPLEIVSKSPLT